MTNKFNVTLTATDKATKVVNKFNKSLNQAFRPYDDAKKRIQAFSQALGRNDLVKRPLWALEKVGKGVTMFGNAFGVAESSVLGGSARIASALGMIGGPIGGFLAGTVALVGGAGAVTVAMANMGQNISRTARNLNISTTELQEYRGAAKLAGLQTEAMDSGLQSLGETLQDSLAGRNLQVATLMGQMGVTIKKTKDGAVDTLAAFRDIADVVSHIKDANQQRKLTDMLGISELLPLLREGSAGLDRYLEKQRQLGIQSDEQIKKNEEQARSWNETKDALDSAGVSIGNLVANFLNLNSVARTTGTIAEALSKSSSGAGSWWGRIVAPLAMGPLGVGKSLGGASDLGARFGNMLRGGTAPEGPRSSGGAVGGMSPTGAGPLGIRNNNPGNIRSGNGFASYATPGEGLTALGRNLVAYNDKHGINTVGGIINRWAPPSENNTGAYIADVSKQTGFGANQALDMHDPKVLAPLISAITKHENGQNPYTPEMIAQAAAAAVQSSQGGDRPITVVVQNVPHGLTVKPVRGLGQATVGLTMQPGGMS